MSIFDSLAARLFSKAINDQVNERVDLAVRVLDDKNDRAWMRGFGKPGDTYPRDRHGYERDEVLADALEAWRVNPLARRIVGLMTQYVVGGGITIESSHKGTNKFLSNWWNDRLNRLPIRIYEWCDELTRSGELFIVISTDAAGMSYLRAIPAADIQDIEVAENDLDQELFVVEKPSFASGSSGEPKGSLGLEGRRWRVYDPNTDSPPFEPVIMHYPINRPVGAKFGESDLAPQLRWLTRYASWLEDRARLNRFRNVFLFWVKAKFQNQAERLERQADLNRQPPSPGSILVTDESEEWAVLSPKLESHEAAEDGLALKKMVAVGSGNPMHFLAEPEGATRTTAESAGGPSFRNFQQRQVYFLWMIGDLARICVHRRKFTDRTVNPEAEIKVTGTDISSRDNSALAAASSTVIGAFSALRDRQLIDDAELLRVAYRFAGEPADVEELLRRGERAGPSKAPNVGAPNDGRVEDNTSPGAPPPGRPGGIEINPITGEPVGADNPENVDLSGQVNLAR